MEHIRAERNEAVLVITLSRGKANALNAALLEELHQAVALAHTDAAVRAVAIVSGSTRIFSAGFDLGEVFHYDDEAMAAVFGRLLDMRWPAAPSWRSRVIFGYWRTESSGLR
jgi:enoyl-CoA hydratase/carnithine racemase